MRTCGGKCTGLGGETHVDRFALHDSSSVREAVKGSVVARGWGREEKNRQSPGACPGRGDY